jgi:formate dehydrogenase major subunit
VPDWSEKKAIQQYREPAGGWGALRATGKALTEQGIPISGSATLLRMKPARRLRLPGMCMARSQTHLVVRVL